ncbi:ATP-grasp domain-containing protein [Wukongibacter sp. M2B1]|uniref:ATP-grasp domain-containing protein n=1 Tax=Wukongibacter sp. M2B1 TaxID=3088895 RepID=UPI003D7954DC
MRILILGGGNCQVNAILRAKEKGCEVIVSDYYDDAPGKEYCDFKELVSTFDIEDNIEVAKKYKIDGVMTIGTDQPVYTAANIAKELSLPSNIDVFTAKAVTNKRVMKNIFKKNGIPTTKFAFIRRGFSDRELESLSFPVVVKPLDSQGQRGVYKLESIQEVRSCIDNVLSFSREEEILVEEYYKNDEITISGWVKDDRVHILTVTDRVTYDNYPHIGICIAHDFPSKHLNEYHKEIEEITNEIVKGFEIHNGPIYFQMLVGAEGIKVNEIACRIGGAYEDEFIPLLTEVDILDMLIDSSLGIEVNDSKLMSYNLADNNKALSVQLFFARPGVIESLGDMNQVKKLPGVASAKFNFNPGDEIKEIKNATQRAGYFIVEGKDSKTLNENIDRVFKKLSIYDNDGNNLIVDLRRSKV